MLAANYSNILWKSIALTYNIFTETASTMMYREGVLYNFIFTEFPFKTVSGDVTAYHRISLKPDELNNLNFHPLEAVSYYRDPQLQVSEKYSYFLIRYQTFANLDV